MPSSDLAELAPVVAFVGGTSDVGEFPARNAALPLALSIAGAGNRDARVDFAEFNSDWSFASSLESLPSAAAVGSWVVVVAEVVVDASWPTGKEGGATTLTACIAVADPAPIPIAAANLIKPVLVSKFNLQLRCIHSPRPKFVWDYAGIRIFLAMSPLARWMDHNSCPWSSQVEAALNS